MKWLDMLFEVLPEESLQEKYDIEAVHCWSVPGVACSKCGWTGPTIQATYPNLILPPEADLAPYENPWPVAPSRLRILMEPLAKRLPPGSPIGAGTGFGPLTGTGSGTFPDFAWAYFDCSLLLSEAAYSALRSAGIDLPTSRPKLRVRSRKPFTFLRGLSKQSAFRAF